MILWLYYNCTCHKWEHNDIPVIDATIYKTPLNGVLYSLFNGGGQYYKMSFGLYYYWVQIGVNGKIISFGLCDDSVTPTPTSTPTNTVTPNKYNDTYNHQYNDSY